jgi:hypothetical protein
VLAPDRLAGVVVLVNTEGVPASDLAKEILKIVLGKSSGEMKK